MAQQQAPTYTYKPAKTSTPYLDAMSAPIPPDADYGPKPTVAQAKAAFKKYFLDRAKDPASIKFQLEATEMIQDRHVSFDGETTYGWRYIGKVNGKNSFGGYSGFEPHFIIMRGTKAIYGN